MDDQDKSKQQLIEELADLRQRMAALDHSVPGVDQENGQQPSNQWWQSLVCNTPLFVLILDRELPHPILESVESGRVGRRSCGKNPWRFLPSPRP